MMEINKTVIGDFGGRSISDCFKEALKTYEEICNCDLATNSSEVQVC